MAGAFKDRISVETVERVVGSVAQAAAARGVPFAAGPTLARAIVGLEALELKDRVRQVARALAEGLPHAAAQTLPVVVAASGEALAAAGQDGGFDRWPLLTLVEEHFVHAPELALPALGELTGRFSAEFAIRPFLRAHPEMTWAAVHAFATSSDAHRRRLASEGTRPRLPWGMGVPALVADPEPGLSVLRVLLDDPVANVRNSVANHLNDISKDHPERLVAFLEEIGAATPERAWIRGRALRSLDKVGHPGALRLLGLDAGGVQLVAAECGPEAVLGENVSFSCVLQSARPTRVELSYGWRWPDRRGGLCTKVFRWSRVELPAGEAVAFQGRHSLKSVTTRRVEAGDHALEIRLNGEVVRTFPVRVLAKA